MAAVPALSPLAKRRPEVPVEVLAARTLSLATLGPRRRAERLQESVAELESLAEGSLDELRRKLPTRYWVLAMLSLMGTFWIHTPIQEQEEVTVQESDPTQPLVLRIGSDRTLVLNGSPVTSDELPDRLRRVFAARSDHVLFFDADDHAPYGFVVQVMDRAREGGAVTIAALTEHLSTQATPPQG